MLQVVNLQPNTTHTFVLRNLNEATMINLKFPANNSIALTFSYADGKDIIEKSLPSRSSVVKLNGVSTVQIRMFNAASEITLVDFVIESKNVKRIAGMRTAVFIIVCIIIIFAVFVISVFLIKIFNSRKNRINSNRNGIQNANESDMNPLNDLEAQQRNDELMSTLQNQADVNI